MDESISKTGLKPRHFFKTILEGVFHLQVEPIKIEYLKVTTGETFIHIGGTAYWNGRLDIVSLIRSGITHWREID